MPTYDATDRYTLRALTDANPGSAIADGFAALRDDVSAKLTRYDAGARSSRPQSTPGVPGIAGQTYRSADGGVDLDTGTAWVTIKPGLFTALPTLSGHAGDGLDEGMEILFQTAAMASALVPPYHLRYDSSLSGTSKWWVLSARPWVASAASVITAVSGGVYADFSDVGPTIALLSVGDWEIHFGAKIGAGSGASLAIAPAATGLTASNANSVENDGNAEPAAVGTGGLSRLIIATAISGTLKLQHKTTGSTSLADQRFISATPKRIG